MASIKKRPDGKWRARYREDGGRGRERSKHFDKKSDAQRWLNEVTASVVTGQYVNPSAGRITFKEYAEQWRLSQPHRVSTQERTENQLRNQVYPAFGARPIADILPSDIQGWVRKLGTPDPTSKKKNGGALAPTTIQVVHGVVSGIFRAAMKDRRIISNPCEGTRLPKTERTVIVPLSVVQIDALTAAMPPHLRALVTFAAGTGVRQGEAFGVTLDRVDFLRKQVRIDRQIQTSPGMAPELRPPKTTSSVRTIPLPQVVIDALAAHLAEFPTGSEGFIFADELGNPLRRSPFGQSIWHPAIKRGNLPAGTTFHDLRHFYASLLIRHGESVKTVQARMGHADASETLNTYSHLWPDSDDQTRIAIDSVLGGPRDADLEEPQNGQL